MIKKLFSFFCILFLSFQLHAQLGINSSTNVNKWRFGGNVGVNFGNDSYFGIGIHPMLGYQITPKLLAGTTLGYTYQKSNYYRNSLFSGGPFANYIIIPQIFTRAHLEHFTGSRTYETSGIKRSFSDDETALWLGGGFQSGGRVGFQIGIMYNVLYKENSSIFNSPTNTFTGVIFSL